VALLFVLALSSEVFAQPRQGHAPSESSRAPYRGADQLDINPWIHFLESMRRDSLAWLAYVDSLENTPIARMRRNLTFTMSDWMPSRADSLRRVEDLYRALDHDFLYPDHPRVPLFSFSPSQVLMALGITEDVTPRIKYTLTSTQPVTVKVYDLEADLVATLVDEVQAPGIYTMTWNFKDSTGNRVRFGDYIAEVMGGTQLLLRKRIVAP
jgi:hypothetical protein